MTSVSTESCPILGRGEKFNCLWNIGFKILFLFILANPHPRIYFPLIVRVGGREEAREGRREREGRNGEGERQTDNNVRETH